MPLQAIIFDFDGVIVDSEKYWEPEENNWFSKILPGWKAEDHYYMPGMSLPDTYHYLCENHGLTMEKEPFMKEYIAIGDRVYKRTLLVEGVKDCMITLHEHGFPLAIASASFEQWIKTALKKNAMENLVQSITSASEIKDGEGKPQPTLFLMAAKKLGTDPNNCIVFEDTEKGVIAAKRAGMTCIAFNANGESTQDLSKADIQITSFSDLNIDQLEALIKSTN